MAACIRARGPSQGPVVNSDGSITVRTDARYVVEGTRTEISQICAALPGFSEQMAESIALLRFDNVIGTFHIPSLGTIQVISEKLDAQSIEGMLYDISQTAADLPFHATEASRFQFHRTGADPQILYHLFVVTEHLIPPDEGKPSVFLAALQAVLANPHRLLRQTIRRTATPLSKRPHVAHLVQDVASPVDWAQVGGTRWIPSMISEEVVGDVVDTPENRFVKHVLATIRWIIEEIMRLLRVQPHRNAFAQSVLDNAHRMLERLNPILQQPLWDQVGAFTFMPTTSTVLHRRYGYQQIYHMYLDLLRSSRVAWSDDTVLTFLQGRDVAQLYELWVYFSVLREVNGTVGKPYKADRIKRSEWGAAVPYGYRVQWPNNISLIYNWTYSRPRRTAYSVPLRPDITLEVGASRHLFDAKFRRKSVTDMTVQDENAEEMEVALERQGDFLRGDIYKMHTYREAISNVDTVWICYPGAEFRFFSWEAVISDPQDFRNGSGGVGAIPLIPARTNDELSSVVQKLVTP